MIKVMGSVSSSETNSIVYACGIMLHNRINVRMFCMVMTFFFMMGINFGVSIHVSVYSINDQIYPSLFLALVLNLLKDVLERSRTSFNKFRTSAAKRMYIESNG